MMKNIDIMVMIYKGRYVVLNEWYVGWKKRCNSYYV